LKTKKSILVFVDWFYPGYLAGGPVQSIVPMVEYLNLEFDFWILTRDRDLNSESQYEGVEVNKWLVSELNCKVYYASPEMLGVKLIKNAIIESKCERAYINGIFSKYFSILPLQILKKKFANIPTIVAPRGMLGAGALSIKRTKKKGFLAYAKISGLYKNINWHAASMSELKDIAKTFGNGNRAHMISNLPKKITKGNGVKKESGTLLMYFSSRISPVKNLLFAIKVLSLIKKSKVQLDLYGLMEDLSYWELCLKEISKLPPNITVNYLGTYNPKNESDVISKYHVLFLPSLNENYGHSIVESLLCGCSVLISDRTPWSDIQEFNAGYALSLSEPKTFASKIESLSEMDEESFLILRENATKYIEGKLNVSEILESYKTLLNE